MELKFVALDLLIHLCVCECNYQFNFVERISFVYLQGFCGNFFFLTAERIHDTSLSYL